MSVELRFGDRKFFCDCYVEGCDIFHKVGEGFRCSGCGTYTTGSFVAVENPKEIRITKLEEALEKISSMAYRQGYYEIVEIVNKALSQ